MKRFVFTPEAPKAVGPYNQAAVDGRDVWVSGQIALIPGSVTPQLDNETVGAETHRVMSNVHSILDAAGCTFDDVNKTRIFLSDMELFGEVNKAYGTYFTNGCEPARECVVAAPPFKGARVEISVDARRPRWPKRLLRKILEA